MALLVSVRKEHKDHKARLAVVAVRKARKGQLAAQQDHKVQRGSRVPSANRDQKVIRAQRESKVLSAHRVRVQRDLKDRKEPKARPAAEHKVPKAIPALMVPKGKSAHKAAV